MDLTAGGVCESRREAGLATGLFLTDDGNVMVDYGKRKVPISAAQYKANGYKPRLGDLKLPAEAMVSFGISPNRGATPPARSRRELFGS
jgi:hypothetical protein